MACKTAIIASDVGGNSELIENYVNGIIIKPHNIDSFVEQINNLFHNKKLRKLLVDNALKTVEEYNWNKVGSLYLNVYESILD